MKRNEEIIAKKYAKAFLNLFIDEISLAMYQRIVELERFFKARREVLAFLALPHIKSTEKCKALDVVIEKFSLPGSFKRLVAILVESKRVFLFPLVLRYITMIYRQRKGIAAFIIKSSTSLDKQALDSIEQFLAKKTDKKILSEHVLDKSLIAGIRLESDQYLWEYSVAKKLKVLMMSPIE